MSNKKDIAVKERSAVLTARRNQKMARSAHAYMRGNTLKFYKWLEEAKGVPEGPSVWICGDCHTGNLGPIANAKGHIAVQIRDLDQAVIGNPAHDLIRLGLSLATAARSSNLPGIMTAAMLEAMVKGYEDAFHAGKKENHDEPEAVQIIMQRALKRRWKHLAKERIEDTSPRIPLGKNFWSLAASEKKHIATLFETPEAQALATLLKSRDNDASVEMLDAAYWAKGCSSLGHLRYAVLLRVGGKKGDLCLMDIKEALTPAAPRDMKADMPRDNAQRVVEAARNLSPHLGERMLATRFMDKAVFMRELLPQDMKMEIEQLTFEEAMEVARYLTAVVGRAHARQMDEPTRKEWLAELTNRHSKTLEAPSWLWSSIVELLVSHEAGYLEHCRKYVLSANA